MSLPQRSSRCAFESLLTLLSGTWTLQILWILRNCGPIRFGELKRKITGISAKVLTDRLRMLEQTGLVDREYKPTIPPQVSYRLTKRAMELNEIFDRLEVIAQKWYSEEDQGKMSVDEVKLSEGEISDI